MNLGINKFLISPRDLKSLVSFSDVLDKPAINKEINNLYLSVAVTCLLNVVIYGFLFLILKSSFIVPFHFSHSLSVYIVLLILFKTIESFFTNRYVNHSEYVVLYDKLNLFREDFHAFFDQKYTRVFNDFYSNFVNYCYKITELFRNALVFSLSFLSLCYFSAPVTLKILFILLGLSILLILILFGSKFFNSFFKIRESLIAHKIPNRKDVIMRVSAPLASNLIEEAFIPVALILMSAYRFNVLIPQVAFLGSIAVFGWALINNLQNFSVAKLSIDELNTYFSNLSQRFVINEIGYLKQCLSSSCDKELLDRSLINKSLILKNFIPKSQTNGLNTKRKVSFEFFPGVYQIHGVNGVGKSTLLQSLSLCEDYLVEFSSGCVCYCGKDFFDRELSLRKHREKIVYLGKNTNLSVNHVDSVSPHLKVYPKIRKIIQDLNSRHSDSFSEGERAVFLILYFLDRLNEGKILIIDELLSRIYEDSEIKLRSSIVELLIKIAKTKGLIIVIVDHAINIPDIKHVKMAPPAKLTLI